jgi:hypothetical protein
MALRRAEVAGDGDSLRFLLARRVAPAGRPRLRRLVAALDIS